MISCTSLNQKGDLVVKSNNRWSFLARWGGLPFIGCMLYALLLGVAQAEALSQHTGPPISEMQLLRERQDILIEAGKNDVDRLSKLFAGIASVFTFAGLFVIWRQYRDDKRRVRSEEQHAADISQMMTAFRENISTVNSLISTLQGTIGYRNEVEQALAKVNEHVISLDEARKGEERAYQSEAGTLNRVAAELFIRCRVHQEDREAFKREEMKEALDSLASHYDTLARTGNLGPLASPVSVFLRGLSFFNSMAYEDACARIAQAREESIKQLSAPLPQYGSWEPDDTKQRLGVIIKEASYHLGIIHYNLGNYEKARVEFGRAFERDQLDFRSRIYIPELMFFDNTIDPLATEAEYKTVEEELNNITTDKRRKIAPKWELLYASLKMRQGNFYLNKDPRLLPRGREAWARLEDPEKALQCFWEAQDKHPSSTFVTFSLAQAMVAQGPVNLFRDKNPDELFQKTFYQFRNEAVLKTEPILLTLLYYCAAISCFHGRIKAENPATYLIQARQHLQRVPTGIRIFSPINKINRERREILEELDVLEQHVWRE